MNPPDIVDLLRGIGIRLDDDALRALLDEMNQQQLSPTQACMRLVEVEASERARRNLARRAHAAALGSMKMMDAFDWAWPKSIDRAAVQTLLTVAFVNDKQNVLLRGPSGLGKTTIAKNLGHIALQAGRQVRFSTIAQMLSDLGKQEGALAMERRMRRYTRPHVLVLDELGYVPHGARGADFLFNVISQRHEQGSTVITTNLAWKMWGEVFDGAASVNAAVDRFAHTALSRHRHRWRIVASEGWT